MNEELRERKLEILEAMRRDVGVELAQLEGDNDALDNMESLAFVITTNRTNEVRRMSAGAPLGLLYASMAILADALERAPELDQYVDGFVAQVRDNQF